MAETPGAAPTSQPSEDRREKDARMWGMLCHLAALCGFVVPFGAVVGPLVVWLVKRDEYPFVNDQGKEALNFQITMMIAFAVAFALVLVFIGILLLPLLGLFDLIMTIVGALKANSGVQYRYPICIRFIK